MKGKKALIKNNMHAYVQRIAKAQEIYGCGYCIAVPSEELSEAVSLLAEKGIRFKGVLELF